MGRRAADLTTPVPVLGVPALVGVRGLKTTGGDRTGGALLQTWGLHCSVGVQTSPGISRPPTQHSIQLTDTLATPSDSITRASNSYIAKETEYKEILLLTKSDKEKRAILKQKSGESKTKKEVTFKALGGEASKDVACSQRNSSGTYCYARAIKTNPHFAGNVTNVRPKAKSAARYTNGSVVDSEAIGGISVDCDEVEPAKSATSRGRDQSRQQGHYAEQCETTPLLSAPGPFDVTRKICSHCGGKQSLTTGVSALGERSHAADACPLQSAPTTLSTATHFQMPHIERNGDLKLTQHQVTSRDNRTHVRANPQILYLKEELRYRKTPHPACPVHSRGNLVTLSQMHAVGDATSTQPTAILRAKSITVTKATIETRQDKASLKTFENPPQDCKVARPTSLTLTPQMATATRPNNPHSHTYPRLVKTSQPNSTQCNVPQNVCVSVHATPKKTLSPPPCSNTGGSGNTSDTHRTALSFNTAQSPTKRVHAEAADAQHETPTLHSTRITETVDTATNTADSPQMTLKCADASDLNVETSVRHSPLSPPPHPAQKPQEKLCDINTTALPTFAKTPNATMPYLNFSVPQCHNAISDQSTRTSPNHNAQSMARQIHIIQPNSSNSEPALHVSTASMNTAPSATKPLHSRARLPSSATPRSAATRNSTLCKSHAVGNSSVSLKYSPFTTSSENQSNVFASRTTLLSRNQSPHINKPSHTQETGIRTQTRDESGVCNVSNQEKSSVTTPPLCEPLNVSTNHNRGGDASTHNLKSITKQNTQSCADRNKFGGNLINELVVHESKDHENSNLLQVTNLQNHISLIKSSSSCLQGGINTEQQRPPCYEGNTKTEHKGHCATCPPVKTAHETDPNTEVQFALGASARHAKTHLKSNADKQIHPSYSTPSVIAQTNCINSSPANTRKHVGPITQTSLHRDSDSEMLSSAASSSSSSSSPPQAHAGAELSLTSPAPFSSVGELCGHTGPECNSILPPSTKHLASLPCLQSCEAESIARPDSKCSPAAPPQPCPEDSGLAHSHPADVALLLPPSPQCCKSAALQQRLETVEASLAANKDRITTLLNIIHDLETCHSPSSG